MTWGVDGSDGRQGQLCIRDGVSFAWNMLMFVRIVFLWWLFNLSGNSFPGASFVYGYHAVFFVRCGLFELFGLLGLFGLACFVALVCLVYSVGLVCSVALILGGCLGCLVCLVGLVLLARECVFLFLYCLFS